MAPKKKGSIKAGNDDAEGTKVDDSPKVPTEKEIQLREEYDIYRLSCLVC